MGGGLMYELIAEGVGKGLWFLIKNYLKKRNCKLITTEKLFDEAISNHTQSIKNWASEITLPELIKAKDTEKSYVPLDFYLYPTRHKISREDEIHKIPLADIITDDIRHAIVLGYPGAGKTTLLKHICNSLFFKDETIFPEFNIPLLIRLREVKLSPLVNENGQDPHKHNLGPIFELFYSIIGLNISYPSNLTDPSNTNALRTFIESLIITILDNMRALILLDGFDEISLKHTKNEIIRDIKKLGHSLEQSSLIITSRTGDFNYRVEKIHRYEICPLTDNQIKIFAYKWLPKESKYDSFIKGVKASPYGDTAIRPLTVAHLCAIYEKSGRIPTQPKSVYKRVVRMLLEEWDEQKPLTRSSKYADFDSDQKMEFLCSLAYVLTVQSRLATFSSDDLAKAYLKICGNFGLPEKQVGQVTDELETHTGLFIQSSSDSYEFAHKSIQEYLTAEYLVKLPSIPTNTYQLYWLANELAIAVAISSSPSDYFVELVNSRLSLYTKQSGRGKIQLDTNFFRSFISRLLVEKPEFNSSRRVVSSFLLLYSIYTELSLDEGTQRLLFHEDILYESFENAVELILKRNKLTTILRQYIRIDEHQALDGSIIFKFKKIGDTLNSFPQFVFCRSTFLKT